MSKESVYVRSWNTAGQLVASSGVEYENFKDVAADVGELAQALYKVQVKAFKSNKLDIESSGGRQSGGRSGGSLVQVNGYRFYINTKFLFGQLDRR